MTEEPNTQYNFGYAARVQLLTSHNALTALKCDLKDRGPALIYTFLANDEWLLDLLAEHLTHSHVQILCDSRQRATLKHLLSEHKLLHVASWATNRTMHSKTLIFPALHCAYLTTANLNAGSWSLSLNTCARIDSQTLVTKMSNDFLEHWRRARPLLP